MFGQGSVVDDEEDKFNQIANTIVDSNKQVENAINEQTEVNKNIFQQIIDLPKNLVLAFLDMLKSLFIPEDEFFTDFFTQLSDFFGDRFGILYYPIDLVIKFLDRIVNLVDGSVTSAVISIPDVKLLGVVLIHSFEYDLYSLLANDTMKTVHNIYLVVVDAILCLMLVRLASHVATDIFGGKYSEDVLSDIQTYRETKKIEKHNREKSNRIGFRHD